MISHGHQLSPPSCRNSPQKKGNTEQLYKTSPPTPKKNNHFYIDKPHTYLTQTYPNLIYLLMYKHLGGWILVSPVKFSIPKKLCRIDKKTRSPPPPHRHFDAAAAPWVDRTLKVGSVGFAVRCSTVGIEEIKEISILVGTGCPSKFLEDDAGSCWSSLSVFLGGSLRKSCKSCCCVFLTSTPFVKRWVFSSNWESCLHIFGVKIPKIFQSTTFSYSCANRLYIE